MKLRKLLHVVAVMLSSLTAMISHGKAQEATTATKEKKGELAKHHRRHHHTGSTRASAMASQDPPARSKIVPTFDSADIKSSKHAATWTSYMEQQGAEPVPVKLDPALMATAERPVEPLAAASTIAPAPLPGDEQSRYPWKRQIVTTTFWVGESASHNNPVPNRASCWDPLWAQNYGGNDAPDPGQRTAEYIPASFTPGQNPFYVALPYNDMEHGAHKAEASQVIRWFSQAYQGPSKSVCKGRWLAIRFGNKICYAQWEDAGPFRTDHWQYVFGSERPRPNLNGGAGLDVSPAVRDYLGMNSSDVTDWKFVDFDEIPTGPWARFGDNNTFVQNSRKGGSTVVELTPAQRPVTLRSIVPDLSEPTVEFR